MPIFAFTAGSLGDLLATAGLTTQVIQVLYDNRNTSKECDNLAVELQSLHQVLILTDFAMQRYESTPLGGMLAHFVRPEVAQCHLSLKHFSERIDSCRMALSFTTISTLWRRIVWVLTDEANSLSAKLSSHRLKLILLLLSLNSVGFLDTTPSNITGTNLHIRNISLSMNRIKDNTIEVVDPLGDTIPIPVLFCSSWESFHHVLKGYSVNRIGKDYVERGDFEIVRPYGDQIIDPSAFARVVKEGQIYEMSIVLRQQAMDKEEGINCPRCCCADVRVRRSRTWMRCSRCSCRFNIDLYYMTLFNLEQDNLLVNEENESEADIVEYPRNRKISQTDDMPDATYFRRITLVIQRMISSDLASSLNVGLPESAPRPSSSRSALRKALKLAKEAVRLDMANELRAALKAYEKSAVILSKTMKNIRKNDQTKRLECQKIKARENELRRLQNICDTYVGRMNILISSGTPFAN